jgi:hypothetical protein
MPRLRKDFAGSWQRCSRKESNGHCDPHSHEYGFWDSLQFAAFTLCHSLGSPRRDTSRRSSVLRIRLPSIAR